MKIKYKYIYSLIFIGAILYFFLINASYASILTDSDWKDSRAYKPRPILFLHGFGQGSPVGWNPTISTLSRWFSKYQPIGSYLETLDFQDPNGSVDTYFDGRAGWADKVKNKVDELLSNSKYGFYTNKLNLVCHSMGGLAAREYLTNPKYATGYVDELILIGVPNLGSRWADLANGISKSQKSGWLIIMPHAFVVVPARNSLDYGLETWLSIDIDGEAVKDMMEDNPFLNALNSRPQSPDVGYYGIYGILGTPLNWFISRDYYGGDGVVSKRSQSGGDRISFKENARQIPAFHTEEPAISVSDDNPLLKFLDSTKPEFEITYPGSGTTEIYESSIHIQGKVYKEYLPADTELIITIIRQEDGYTLSPQNSLLEPSDLWAPNNSDSPVAEFDELINFPSAGTYIVSLIITNPAGLSSDEKTIQIKAASNEPIKIFPIEKVSLHCWAVLPAENGIHAAMLDARRPKYDSPKFWGDFVIGQSLRKYRDLYDENIYYGVGFHRCYLSFNTSALKGKKIKSAKLVMYYYGRNFNNGGLPFYLRFYSGSWGRINADFTSWYFGTALAYQIHSDFITPNAFNEHIMPDSIINTEGKTQFRICSSREEDLQDPVEPPLGEGTGTIIDHSKMVAELINWDRDRIWLEIEVEP